MADTRPERALSRDLLDEDVEEVEVVAEVLRL
jgi:hypothetical protein